MAPTEARVDEEVAVEGQQQEIADQPVDSGSPEAIETSPEPVVSETSEVSAAPVPGTPVAPAAPPAVDWAKLGAVDLSGAPAGMGLSMAEVAKMRKESLGYQRELQESQASLQHFRTMFGNQRAQQAPPQQPQVPSWAQAQEQQPQYDDSLDGILGAPQQQAWAPEGFVNDWQGMQSQMQAMQQQNQQLLQHYGNMERERLTSEITQRYPDVPEQSINLALAQGIDPDAYAAQLQQHINGIRASSMRPGAGAPAPGQPHLQAVPAPGAPPRPAHVGGRGSPAGNQPWDALPKHNQEAYDEASLMMQSEGLTAEQIERHYPRIWRELHKKAV